MSDLREALDNAVIFDRRDNVKHVVGRARETSRTIKAAARRFLHLAETGQRVKRDDLADAIDDVIFENFGVSPSAEAVEEIMDELVPGGSRTYLVIPADYLTEED